MKFGLTFLVIVVGAIISTILEYGFHIQRTVAHYCLGMIVGMFLERVKENLYLKNRHERIARGELVAK